MVKDMHKFGLHFLIMMVIVKTWETQKWISRRRLNVASEPFSSGGFTFTLIALLLIVLDTTFDIL